MIRVNIFGDICLYGISRDNLLIDRKIAGLMDGAVNIGNLECPITESQDKMPLQAINLKASPKVAEKALNGFHALSLANNHIQNYRQSGIDDTVEFLETHNFQYFGIENLPPPMLKSLRPVIISAGVMKIAVIGASRYDNVRKGKCAGTVNEQSPLVVKTIRQLKKNGHFVIVYPHWGYEYVRIPAPRERSLAHRFIDNGADFVVGSHPHVFQGHEFYHQKQIYYSLGNYIFSHHCFEHLAAKPNDDRLWNSFFVELQIRENNDYTVIPHFYTIESNDSVCKITLLNDASEMEAELEHVSGPLKDSYFRYWKKYYQQAVAISRQNIKVRKNFQKVSERTLKEKMQIYFSFNSQDLRNRLAGLFSCLFK